MKIFTPGGGREKTKWPKLERKEFSFRGSGYPLAEGRKLTEFILKFKVRR